MRVRVDLNPLVWIPVCIVTHSPGRTLLFVENSLLSKCKYYRYVRKRGWPGVQSRRWSLQRRSILPSRVSQTWDVGDKNEWAVYWVKFARDIRCPRTSSSSHPAAPSLISSFLNSSFCNCLPHFAAQIYWRGSLTLANAHEQVTWTQSRLCLHSANRLKAVLIPDWCRTSVV